MTNEAPSRNHFDKLFWLVPFVLCILQAWQTYAAWDRIRYEDLAESIRNVYWLEHREIYDGVSSNIGWYAILLFVYKTFGFSLHTAKIVKLALYTLSIFALGWTLKRSLGHKQSLLPLIALGLSPSWL